MAIRDKTATSRSATNGPGLLPDFPRAVPDLLDLPGFIEQERRYNDWWDSCRKQISYVNNGFSESLTQRFGNLSATVRSDITVIANELEALAVTVDSVSATMGEADIYVQSTAPSDPSIGDLWVDTSDLNRYKFWNGTSWEYKQDGVLAAAVSAESLARATADGFLEGKYTLTVVAGNVVTGMNVTSATGGGTDISSVIFQADQFKIYNGASGIAAFNLTGSDLTLNTSITLLSSQVAGLGALAGEDFIAYGDISGTKPPIDADVTLAAIEGSLILGGGGLVLASGGASIRGGMTGYNSGTGFWLGDSGGTTKLSIGNSAGDKLLWTGSALEVTGTLNATSGSIGGFSINSTSITATDFSLDSSSGEISVGTSNDRVAFLKSGSVGELVVYRGGVMRIELGATSGSTFLSMTGGSNAIIYLGNVELQNSFDGTLSVSGAVSASSGSFSGSVTADSFNATP